MAINPRCDESECKCPFKSDCICRKLRINEKCPRSRYESCVDEFNTKMGMVD
jgi:hypothetical protein